MSSNQVTTRSVSSPGSSETDSRESILVPEVEGAVSAIDAAIDQSTETFSLTTPERGPRMRCAYCHTPVEKAKFMCLADDVWEEY